MKTKIQFLSFLILLGLLIPIVARSQAPIINQTVATPTVFTTLSAGSPSVTGASLAGADSWFKWTAGDGIIKLNAKITRQGSSYQNSTAELYKVLSADSIHRVSVDSLHSDSTLHLAGGYFTAGDVVYIRFVNANNTCSGCTYANPLVDFTIFSTTSGCSSSPCSLTRNGNFEQANAGACAGYNILDGVDCWFPFENSSDVFRRNCTANGWNNLGSNTYQMNPVLDSHNGPPNNTVIGQLSTTSPIYNNDYYSESVQNLLAAPLLPGHIYELSFWAYNYSGQELGYRPINLMSSPCWLTFCTATGLMASPAPNPSTSPMYPIGYNTLYEVAVSPINTWTAYTYTFTYSGPAASNLMVGTNVWKNYAYGYNNRAINPNLYLALDDIEIRELTPLSLSPTTICAGKTGTLTASGMNTYNWQPGNMSGATVTVNPIVTTVYTVTGTYSSGCTKTQTVTVTVDPLPNISTLQPSIGICPGSSATLGALGGTSYTWAPCSTGCNLNSLVVSPTVNTTYTVTGMAAGCTNTATTYVYILNPTNSINISGYSTICQGEAAYLSASGATNYTWAPCNSGCNTATLAPTPSVTTTYTVRGINPCGMLSASTVQVIVKPTFPVNPAVLSNPACVGNSVSLIANGGSPYSYTWTPGNMVGTMVTVTPSVTTTYTACTSVPGCTNTCAAVTVTMFPAPQLTITPISPTVCAGTATTISASGATTYTWSTGSNGTSISVTPTVATVYSVAATYSDCPTITASSTVNVYPALTVTAAPNVTTCPGTNFLLTASGGTGAYSWAPGGATTASVIVSPTVPTVYTVTSTNGSCSLTATSLVTPILCCAVSNDLPFNISSGSISGGIYNLNQPLTLTGNLSMDNLTIFMGSNAEIIVPNGMKLMMTGVHLLGCPQMWKGIRSSGANVFIEVTKNSLIEDAITAIDLSTLTTTVITGPILHIENTTFNKNYTAIRLANYDATAGDFPMWFANNVFTSRKLITPDHRLVNPALTVTFNWPAATVANLKGFATIPNTFNPDADLQTGYEFSAATYSTSNLEVPNSNMVGHQGIYLENVYSPGSYNGFRMVGNETQPYVYSDFNYFNVFDNLHFGIKAVNSNLMVATAAFQNMSQYVAGVDPNAPRFKVYDGGVGIQALSTMASGLPNSQTFSVTVGPLIYAYNKTTNFFLNNPYGIKTENIQYVTAGYNIFHSKRQTNTAGPFQVNAPVGMGEYAMYIKSFDYRDINIRRNFTANISNGFIFMATSNHLFGNVYASNTGSVTVQNNSFKANYGSTITNNQSLTQAIAIDNLVTPAYLYAVSGSTAAITVYKNLIDKAYNGIEASNWNRQRIIVSTNTVTLADNGAINTPQYGIQHSNNLGDQIFSNTIKGFNTTKVKAYGIVAAENKSQAVWCNSTENSYYGIVFKGSQNLTDWRNNTMKTHQRAMLLDNTTIGTQGAPNSPIANVWAGSWTGAYKLYVNLLDPGTPAGNSRLYLSNLPSSTESDAFPNTARYKTIFPQSLFYTTGISRVECPYTDLKAQPLIFRGQKDNLHNIVADSFAYGANLNANRKNGRLAVYRAMLEDSTLAASDSLLAAFKSAADASNIGKLFQVEQYIAEGNLSSAQTALAAITPGDTVEDTQKKMYRIYLRSRLDAYTAADESDLIELANACPEQMGVGVFQARTLLNSLYSVYYHFASNCGDTSRVAYRKGRNAEQGPEVAEGSFLIYPNPSSGTVFFSAADMGIENYQVTVYDITGKAIFVKEYQDGERVNAINMDLSSGVYLMQLTDKANGDVYKRKFIIQK